MMFVLVNSRIAAIPQFPAPVQGPEVSPVWLSLLRCPKTAHIVNGVPLTQTHLKHLKLLKVSPWSHLP